MAEKKFKGAPFGTQSARFDVSAVHPANKRVGTYTEISYCKRRTSELERNLGPGLYNADRGDFSVRATAERAKGPGWQRAQETARLAKIPHILYREAWENKHFLKTKVGPGTYRIPDFMEELEKKPGSVRGVCESREERFREPQSWTPGPGSYGKGGVPCAALEEKRTRSGGVDMELSSGLKRFPEDPKTCGPCPCTYTLKSCTDILRNRKTSERGPYDLFTGPRDEPIVSGYFAAPKCAAVTPGDYSPESFSEQLFRREKKRHGVFSVLDQYPAMPHDRIYHSTLSQYPRPATFPGPCEYETSPPRSNRSSAHVFSSAQRLSKMSERLQNKNFTSVGPGRYDIAEKGQRKSANGHTSSFSSRTQRYLANLRRDKHTQERLRAINLPVERQSSLTPIGPSLRNRSDVIGLTTPTE